MNAENLATVFEDLEVSGIYLNFSDPWPKDRHYKRRLTYRGYLDTYGRLLKPGGQVIFKTDNRTLFDFSLIEAEAAGWTLDNVSYDLHHSPDMGNNVMTEYEAKFSGLGHPICRLIAHK